jgi:DNA-binding IclR family transcriptional regulator
MAATLRSAHATAPKSGTLPRGDRISVGTNDGPAASPLQTVDRALQVLDLFGPAQADISTVEVARELGIDRSIASRLLGALESRGYVTQDETTQRYCLGLRALDLGAFYLQSHRLVAAASPHLELLASATSGTANVFLLDSGNAVRLASYPARPMTRLRVPAHCTAAGKVLLAALDDTSLALHLQHFGLLAQTPRTVTTAEALRQELARVREQGYALEREENILGRGCIAAPVRDILGRTSGAISVSLLASQLSDERLAGLADLVREAALRVGEGLGNRPLTFGVPGRRTSVQTAQNGTERATPAGTAVRG